MRFAKYLFALTLAFLVCVSYSKAAGNGTVVWVGGGSSALFLEVGQAAAAHEQNSAANSNGACVYSYSSNTVDWAAKDNRIAPADLQLGKIWIVYGTGGSGGTCAAPNAPFNIYAYLSLDSVLGNRCFFEVDSSDNNPGCIQVSTPSTSNGAGCNEVTPPSSGSCAAPNLLATVSTCNTTYVQADWCDIGGANGVSLPSTVSGPLNGLHWNFAGTDVRPEDAKYASYRVFTPCGTPIWRSAFDQGLRQVYGLGYQTSTTGVGVTIQESNLTGGYNGSQFTVLDFSLSGADVINTSHNTYSSYTVTPVGAQPIVVAVGPAGGPWTGVTDVPGLTLTLFYQGVLGRTTDFAGASAASQEPVTTLVREPLSGTYNTFEYSVPNSSQFHGSQDDNNCSGSSVQSNPMDLNGLARVGTTDGVHGNGFSYRERSIGTGNMVKSIVAGSTKVPTLGYFFWSVGNASKFTSTNGKYLTVNGVDPFYGTCNSNPVACGMMPNGGSGLPVASSNNFVGLQAGDYAIWSPLRLVTSSGSVVPSGTGLANIEDGLNNAVYGINPTQHDYVAISNLKVWHSHYYLPSIGINNPSANGTLLVDIPANGGPGTTLCPTAGAVQELGGDAGGSNLLTQNNYDFCVDYSQLYGIINKNN